MKFYVQRKTFSNFDNYAIFDEHETKKFEVLRNLKVRDEKLHLYDSYGLEKFSIVKGAVSQMEEYQILKGDMPFASVGHMTGKFDTEIVLTRGRGEYALTGDLHAGVLEIIKNNLYFGHISRKFLSWGECYETEIDDPEEVPFFGAVAVIIDNFLNNMQD